MFRRSRPSLPSSICLAAAFAIACGSLVLLRAGDDSESDEDGAEAGKEEPADAPEKPAKEIPYADRLIAYFKATEEKFDEEGILNLTYDFESMTESLTEDWTPNIADTKRKVRWSRGSEGTFHTVEHGIVIADDCMWFHKAEWKHVTLNVKYLSVAGSKPGDCFAAAFSYNKGKRTIGSNVGVQCVTLAGGRIAGKPISGQPMSMVAESKYEFGFELKDGVFKALRDGSPRADTSENPKALKDLGPGRAGFVWHGMINGFITHVTIRGELDPDWVASVMK